MKYLIFSDSHGASNAMIRVIERCLPLGVDGVLFLGDGMSDLERARARFSELEFIAVAGNCDLSARYIGQEWRERLIEIEGVRVLMMHGHHHGVKYGIDSAAAYARAKGADILLYGHTHVPVERYLGSQDGERALYIFNPGSMLLPQYGEPTFGTLTIKDGSILFGHANVFGGAK